MDLVENMNPPKLLMNTNESKISNQTPKLEVKDAYLIATEIAANRHKIQARSAFEAFQTKKWVSLMSVEARDAWLADQLVKVNTWAGRDEVRKQEVIKVLRGTRE